MDNAEKNSNISIEHIKKICFWRSAFFGLIILFAGIAIGGASMSILAAQKSKKEPPRIENTSLMPRLTRTLGLQPQQINKIKPILDGYMQHLYEIRENARFDIADTLDQMNREISPVLGDVQKRVWQQELVRIQTQLNPELARNQQGGRGRGRGAVQTGQGGGGGVGRLGRGGQPLNQRPNTGQRRGQVLQPSAEGPNSLLNNVNENAIGIFEPNDVNE
ncbi:MAG: hypothetical protein JW787_13995 [Sedimentisphaerales bacterium]|nr:hypothetical protein [Sedimentisphaerales bacterium]